MTAEIKIGLEIHSQITALKTKLFCACSADYRGKEPNTLVCPVCIGLPGSLPTLNRKAIEYAIMAALAMNCEISRQVLFFRKNYYYPDLCKGFQISQFDKAGGVPLAKNGFVEIRAPNGTKRRIRIRRIHLEEDPARLVYTGTIDSSPHTFVDYNRSGVALLEIVTEPDLSSPKETRSFLKKVRSILEHLGICDGGLEGALRCDANISITGGPRVEIKNITSFKEVERALSYEITRQKELGKVSVKRETRHWDELRKVTVSLRIKEEEYEYRYFPEPDLVPIIIGNELISKVKEKMPELPDMRCQRFITKYGLPKYDAEVLTSEKALADYFEECVSLYTHPKVVSNWLMTDFLRYVHEIDIDIRDLKTTPKQFVDMLLLIDRGIISRRLAKSVLRKMMMTGKHPKEIIEKKRLIRIIDKEILTKVVEQVFLENPKAVEDALKNEKAVNFLIGVAMKLTKGKADPKLTNKLVREKLKSILQKRSKSKE